MLPPQPITQNELQELEALQRLSWQAHMDASQKAGEIMRRLNAGAELENGPLFFDLDLKMARTRKEKTG